MGPPKKDFFAVIGLWITGWEALPSNEERVKVGGRLKQEVLALKVGIAHCNGCKTLWFWGSSASRVGGWLEAYELKRDLVLHRFTCSSFFDYLLAVAVMAQSDM